MLSFTDFLIEKSNLMSNRLLIENVEEDVYWLGVNFFNYLYFIKNSKFSDKENFSNGKPLTFISTKTNSNEKAIYESVFDFPVTLYFDKKNLLDYIDSLEKKPLTEDTTETDPETTDTDSLETVPSDDPVVNEPPEEEKEIPTDLTLPINKFTLDITKNKNILTKVEINFKPIDQMVLEKDFKDYTRLLFIRYTKSLDDMIQKIKNQITTISNKWIDESGYDIKLIFSE